MKDKKEKKAADNSASCRLGKVGGQAVIEGVMMKAGEHTVTTCRKEDGSVVVCDDTFVSVRKKHKILNFPILRGIINFVEMMKLSVKTLGNSADALGLDDEDSKSEQWMRKHLGIGLTDLIMIIGVVLGVLLAIGLFMVLPALIADGIDILVFRLSANGAELGVWRAAVEGAVKVLIFVSYLLLVSLMNDIKRTFMYHGAEHKTIACFEAGEELTPENAMKHKRFHPRCGTSFMFVMILLGIIVGFFVRILFENILGIYLHPMIYVLIRLGILPIVVGLGYEFIIFAGKHDNIVTRVLSAPGLWMQRITTKEPTLDMLEVAIISTKCALRDEFDEFREFYESRAWESKCEGADGENAENTADGENADAEAVADMNEDADSMTASDEAIGVQEVENTDGAPASAADSEGNED